MLTIEQARKHLPIGTRVRHRVHDRAGAIAQSPPEAQDSGAAHLVNQEGICFCVYVQWDGDEGPFWGRGSFGGWAGPWDLERVLDGEPSDAGALLDAAMRQVGKESLDPEVENRDAVKMALWMAYHGDRETLQKYLARCAPEGLEKLVAGAALLAEEVEALKARQ
ncbi:hypothetical protein ACFYY8_33670 [Streptosporangium sp. NPDC001559]|uniref:hypothetical protein n=1 Tax=Streptosporangium sp. NPDC001559 TaxID=3366187 RepID=UPI0036ED92BE